MLVALCKQKILSEMHHKPAAPSPAGRHRCRRGHARIAGVIVPRFELCDVNVEYLRSRGKSVVLCRKHKQCQQFDAAPVDPDHFQNLIFQLLES
jgi:hypothetical protein